MWCVSLFHFVFQKLASRAKVWSARSTPTPDLEPVFRPTGGWRYFSRTLFEVFVCIVQKLEERRSFGCIQTSDRWIILVRMIFARELLIVNLNFSFGCSESKPKNCEWLRHAAPDLYAEILVIEPSFWIVFRRVGRDRLRLLLVHRGRASRWRGRLVPFSSSWVITMALSMVSAVVIAIIAILFIIIVIIVICITVRRAPSASSASCMPRR